MQTFTTETTVANSSTGRIIARFMLNTTFSLDNAYQVATALINDQLDPEGVYNIEIQQHPVSLTCEGCRHIGACDDNPNTCGYWTVEV